MNDQTSSKTSFLFLFSYFILSFLCDVGASLYPGPDNTRYSNNNNNNNQNYNNNGYNNNPSSANNGHSVDRNQIFGNPAGNFPNSNQPWNNLPIFPPNPTSNGHGSQPQQSLYPQAPSFPQNPNLFPNGIPPQFPFAFGFPPPGSQQHNIHNIYPRPTTRSPSLLDQFLYNKSGRRNSASTLHATWECSSFIVIISICNVLARYILTNHNYQ